MDKDYEWMKSKKSIVILVCVRVCVCTHVCTCVPVCTYTGTSGGQKPLLAVDPRGNCIVCILFIYLLTFLLKFFHTIYFNHIFLLLDPPQVFLHPAL